MTANKCAICGADYQHGSGLYDYYVCGHAFEKPLDQKDAGKWVIFRSPYYPKPDKGITPTTTEPPEGRKKEIWTKN